MADKTSGGWQDGLSYVVAIAALLAFAWFIIFLLHRTNTSELEWTRGVYLLTGVEAIVFAAAGFLFGREVNRARAEQAEARAATAEVQKSEAENQRIEAVTKGRNLAAVINAKMDRAKRPADFSLRGTVEATGAPAGATVSQADLEELQRLAQEMFPN